MSKAEVEFLVELLLEDLKESSYMGSMWLALSSKQKSNMKERWSEILLNGQCELEINSY